MSLIQSLELLVDILEMRGVSIRSRLRPGISATTLLARFETLGLVLPPDLSALYAWHDGVEDEHYQLSLGLFGEYQFLTLEQALQEYTSMATYYSSGSLFIDLSKCFPFASFQGDYCTMYCSQTPVSTLVYPIINIYDSITILFESLNQMTETALAWIQEGVYDANPVDEYLRSSIRKRINPYLAKHTIALE